jgi:hypothetical protein
MSLAYRTDQRADTKHRNYGFIRDYGFILALVCLALALVVVGAIFTPPPVASELSTSVPNGLPFAVPRVEADCANKFARDIRART